MRAQGRIYFDEATGTCVARCHQGDGECVVCAGETPYWN